MNWLTATSVLLWSAWFVGLSSAEGGVQTADPAPVVQKTSESAAQKQPETGTKEQVIEIIAKKFEYIPGEIKLKKGQSVILRFKALDFDHGFLVPDLIVNGKPLRSDLKKGQTVDIRFVPDKAGKFPFHCDNFCGLHHEDMEGLIVVE